MTDIESESAEWSRNRAVRLLRLIAFEIAPIPIAVCGVAAFLLSWGGWTFSDKPNWPNSATWVGLALPAGLNLGLWLWTFLVGMRLPSPPRRLGRLSEIDELLAGRIPDFHRTNKVIPAIGILLVCVGAIQQAEWTSGDVSQWTAGFGRLLIGPLPTMVNLVAGFVALAVSLRLAAINAGGVMRLPRKTLVCGVIVSIAITGFITDPRSHVLPNSLHIHMTTVAFTIAAIWLFLHVISGVVRRGKYIRSTMFSTAVILSGAILACHSAGLGLIWAGTCCVIGNCVDEWTGWLRVLGLGSVGVVITNATKWLTALACFCFAMFNPAESSDFSSHYGLLVASVVLCLAFYRPQQLFPTLRLPVASGLSSIDLPNANDPNRVRKVCAQLRARAAERLNRAGCEDARQIRLALVDLNGIQWLAAPDGSSEVLANEATLLRSCLNRWDGDRCPSTVDSQEKGRETVWEEIDLRLLAAELLTGSQTSDRDRSDQLHNGLDKFFDDSRVVTRWLLWRGCLKTYPDPEEATIQKKKLLRRFKAARWFAIISELPSDLWIPANIPEFDLLRIAELAAWKSVVLAARVTKCSSDDPLWLQCLQRWERIHLYMVRPEFLLDGLRNVDPGDCFDDACIAKSIFEVSQLAKPLRPIRKQAEVWTIYAERLSDIALVRLYYALKRPAAGMRRSVRKRISRGFTFDPPESYHRRHIDSPTIA